MPTKPERGSTHRYYRITGAQDNLRVKLPEKAYFYAHVSCENACEVQLDGPNSAMETALASTKSRDMPATTEKPAQPCEGNEIIRIEVATGTVGEIQLYVEGDELPEALETDETAP